MAMSSTIRHRFAAVPRRDRIRGTGPILSVGFLFPETVWRVKLSRQSAKRPSKRRTHNMSAPLVAILSILRVAFRHHQ